MQVLSFHLQLPVKDISLHLAASLVVLHQLFFIVIITMYLDLDRVGLRNRLD